MGCAGCICDYILGLLLRLPVIAIYVIATYLQYISLEGIFELIEGKEAEGDSEKKDPSICIHAHEISSAVAVYIIFTVCPIIPNVCYIIGIFLLPRLCRDPLSIVYNAAMGTMGIIGGLVLESSLTYCGNEDQTTISTYSMYGLIAGLLHTINAIYIHIILPWRESYVKRREK